jgi:hypothetical protein|tara:strand:- start:652 stop:846 length:195 start_codon:yes stop_codon:yes gene_type:complete
MKTYTLTIIYNETTGELESLEERIDEDTEPVAINASEEVMNKISAAGLVESLLMSYPGECVGEA